MGGESCKLREEAGAREGEKCGGEAVAWYVRTHAARDGCVGDGRGLGGGFI